MKALQKAVLVVSLAISALAFAAPSIAAASTQPAVASDADLTVVSMGGCGERRDVYTSGAEAHWTINCHPEGVSVVGWVKDTDADNQCAEVYAFFPADGQTRHSPRACPEGDVEPFDLRGPGSSANVYLREVG